MINLQKPDVNFTVGAIYEFLIMFRTDTRNVFEKISIFFYFLSKFCSE